MDPYIIVLGNEKGGTGKSTLAMHLLVCLLKEGASVASLDLDARQGTLSRYLANRTRSCEKHNLVMPQIASLLPSEKNDKISAQQEDEEAFLEKIETLGTNDFIVIDTPGSTCPLSRIAHAYADTLVTPLNDSFIDLDLLVRVEPGDPCVLKPSIYAVQVWECKKEKASRSGRPLDWVVLRNRLSPLYTKNKEEMLKILSTLSKRIGFILLDGFGERVIFRELFREGTTLLDLQDTGSSLTLSHVAARHELRLLRDALNLPKGMQKAA
jgi:chromosome partitioning protein